LFNSPPTPANRIQGRLLILAAIFLFLFSTALSLSPAARVQSWQATYLWQHWLGYTTWLVATGIAHIQTARRLPYRDPYLLPAAALLSGWGLLTIFRLTTTFGYRQSIWLLLASLILVVGLRLPADLGLLRRYKYLWLTFGLLLTGLTFLLGTNPSGAPAPRLWLGGFGVFLQPSEPLKLLLVVYLAAYLAGGVSRYNPRLMLLSRRMLPLLSPTLLMTGIALLLLILQRDLGTAIIFLFLYAIIVYIVSGNQRILLLTGLALLAAGIVGYSLFDVVRLRLEAWANPWSDPSGRSYQIVQSLLAIANGGLFGRGPGMGSPGLVPIPHSDFIFVSIVEETGLAGALGLLLVLGLVTVRGLRTALFAPDSFRRFLSAGLTAYLVSQSVLIIGGNVRMLPLTGVTLPFVSYGGSSLLTSYLALLFLLIISNQEETRPAPLMTTPRIEPAMYLHVGGFLLSALAIAGLFTGWWAVYRAPELLARTDNPRLAIADRYTPRGSILARDNTPLVLNLGEPGSYTRQYLYIDLAPVLGYTHIVYGRSGLEDSLDPYLRGLEGYSNLTGLWNHLLYGQPPPGLHVRLTLDIELQRQADELLNGRAGSLVLLNPQNGEILAMASHPSFDPNRLEEDWSELIQDPATPLVNRAVQGQYQPGTTLGPFIMAAYQEQRGLQAGLPPLPSALTFPLEQDQIRLTLNCASQPADRTWAGVIRAGCPAPIAVLGEEINTYQQGEPLLDIFERLGFYETPALRLPAAVSTAPDTLPDPQQYSAIGQAGLLTSPLQMALAAATLSTDGIRPAPRLVQAVQTAEGWMNLPYLKNSTISFSGGAASSTAFALRDEELPIWQSIARAQNSPGQAISWYIGGTLPDWTGSQLSLALLLEGDDPLFLQEAGRKMLEDNLQP
jgi:cell division protein FtsW (lipid II flippase)